MLNCKNFVYIYIIAHTISCLVNKIKIVLESICNYGYKSSIFATLCKGVKLETALK